jgi:hypothetical protein
MVKLGDHLSSKLLWLPNLATLTAAPRTNVIRSFNVSPQVTLTSHLSVAECQIPADSSFPQGTNSLRYSYMGEFACEWIHVVVKRTGRQDVNQTFLTEGDTVSDFIGV